MTGKQATTLIIDDEVNTRLLVSSMPGEEYVRLKATDGGEASCFKWPPSTLR